MKFRTPYILAASMFLLLLVFNSWSLKPERLITKWAPRSRALRCPKIEWQDHVSNYAKSQTHEDKELMSWFNGLCGGTYMEMGALDGVKMSNTHFFHYCPAMGQWKGLLVELGPNNYAKLKLNRKEELAVVNAAVCGEAKTLHYVERDNVGGIWEFAAEGFKQEWWPGMTLADMTPVECKPLQDIIRDNVRLPFFADFFSLDIEGAELMALQSLDFDSVSFGILVVEADDHNELKNRALQTFLSRKGYTYLYDKWRSSWFINDKFDEIYSGLLHSN